MGLPAFSARGFLIVFTKPSTGVDRHTRAELGRRVKIISPGLRDLLPYAPILPGYPDPPVLTEVLFGCFRLRFTPERYQMQAFSHSPFSLRLISLFFIPHPTFRSSKSHMVF